MKFLCTAPRLCCCWQYCCNTVKIGCAWWIIISSSKYFSMPSQTCMRWLMVDDALTLHFYTYKCEYKESRRRQTLLTGLRPAAYLGRVSTCDWCLVSLFDSDYPDDNWIGRLVGPRSPGPGPHKPDCKTPSVSRGKIAMELFLRDILSWCWPGTASCLVWPDTDIWRYDGCQLYW